MKTLLHIGTEKTGSTSFQTWGAQNRDELARQGVWYSRELGDVNHVKAYLYATPIDAPDEGFGRIKANDPEARKAFQQELPAKLAAEFADARAMGCHTFVMSNEHCQSRLRDQDQVRRLHSLFAPHSDEIEVLCYLRPQIDMAVSLLSLIHI